MNQKVLQALKRLNTCYNPTLNALVMKDVAFVGGGYDDYKNPVTFDDAWNYRIDEDKEKWRTAICKEFHHMKK